MASKKRKAEADESDGRKKRSRVIFNDDDDDYEYDTVVDESEVRRLSQNQFFTSTTTSTTEREAGIIEEVRLVNFMSHPKLIFEYVVPASYATLYNELHFTYSFHLVQLCDDSYISLFAQ